jgi:glycosyltransferase involved in cell wall biosynthesis
VTANASLERLRASRRPRLLFVSHAPGGGVGRHVAELARAVADDVEVLLLHPHGTDSVALRWLAPGADFALWLRKDEEWERVVAILAALGIDRVHFHHVHGLPRSVLELPRRLGAAHDVTLHDYYPACPTYHLTDGRGRYCGGTPACRHCLEARPAQWPVSIDEWRAEFGRLLDQAARVIAPSEDAAGRMRAFFPAAPIVVWPHAEDDPPAAAAPWRVLVPGAISPAKGLAVLEACVEDAAARALPLHFRVLGFTAHAIPAWPERPCSVTGEYREVDLPALVALERGDAFFFPAQVPETFSYTLSAALATPLPIVATDLGAFGERLAGRANARIVRSNAGAGEMNDAILEAIGRPAPEAAVPSRRMTPAAYRERYLAGLARGAPPGPAPGIDVRWLVAPPEPAHLSTLAWLYDDGVRAGRGASLAELRRRTGEADDQLRRDAAEIARQRKALAEEQVRARIARSEIVQLRADRERLATENFEVGGERDRNADEVRDLRGHLEIVERSRSWRLTAPLRALARLLRSR